MTALVLTFLASCIGAALVIREARRPEWNPGWLLVGFLILWVGLAAMLTLLVLWAVA